MMTVILAVMILAPISLVGASNTQNKITIDPSIIKIEAKQGDSASASFVYTNGTPRTQEIDFSISPFKSENGSSQPVFYDKDGVEVSSPAKDWIKIENGPSKVLAGGDQKISFVIKIPKKAEVGSYQNAIFVNSSSVPTADNNGSSNTINYRIGALIFLEVGSRDISFLGKLFCSPIPYLILFAIAILIVLVRINKKKEKMLFAKKLTTRTDADLADEVKSTKKTKTKRKTRKIKD